MNYYNDFDPFVCAWARELIAAGHAPPGLVDERSIRDVNPEDLNGYRQCHFFSGILGWPVALRIAGWPDARPVWTASCPCQPFSSAGKGEAEEDERHLWPTLFAIVRECRPDTIFGEQVASKAGRKWFAGVREDLRGVGYEVAAADIRASAAGAPHIRQRIFFAATMTGKPAGLIQPTLRIPLKQMDLWGE